MTTKKRAPRGHGSARRVLKLWVPLTVAWTVPLLVLLLIPTGETPQTRAGDNSAAAKAVAQEVPSATVVVERVDGDLKEGVILTFDLEAESLPKVATGGLVTGVHFDGDGPVTEGSALISVDRVKLLVHRGEVPFHRELSARTSGKDVIELARFLTAAGYKSSAGAGATLDAQMVRSIKKFQRDIGAAPDGIFRPQTTIHIAADVRRLGGVSVVVGARVAPGDTFTKPAARAIGARLESGSGNALKVAEYPGPFTLTVRTATEPLVIPLDSLTFTTKQANALREQLLDAEAELNAEAGVESLSGATLALAQPETSGTVPMSALYASTAGTLCIFEVSSSSADLANATAVPVRTAAPFVGVLSQAAIDADLVGRIIVREAHQLSSAATGQCGAN